MITQTVFQSTAGENFRRFQLGPGRFIKINTVNDFTRLKPFEKAVLSYSPPDLPDKIELNLKGVPRIVQHGGRYWI